MRRLTKNSWRESEFTACDLICTQNKPDCCQVAWCPLRISKIKHKYLNWTWPVYDTLAKCWRRLKQDHLCSLALLPLSLFPTSPTCLLPTISSFDLCYLALILWGESGLMIEGDGVNITEWHFSVIWHHRSQDWWYVRQSTLIPFKGPDMGYVTFSF